MKLRYKQYRVYFVIVKLKYAFNFKKVTKKIIKNNAIIKLVKDIIIIYTILYNEPKPKPK